MFLSKTSVIILLIILFHLNPLIAADNDSLRSVLKSAEGKDRIKILMELMAKLQRTTPDEAAQYGHEALRLIKIYPDKNTEARILNLQGWTHYYRKDIDSARTYAKLTGLVSKNAGFKPGLAMESLLTARILRTEGLYENALKLLADAEEKNNENGDMLLRIKILNETGSVYRRLSRFDEAYAVHMKALELLKEYPDEDELTTTYTFLGIVSDIMGDYDEALSFHHKALDLNKKNNDIQGTAGSIHNIGILYQKIEKYDEALRFYDQALKYWEILNNKDGFASTLNSIGAVNELKGNYKKALKYYKDALEIWEDSGSGYSTAIALNNIGSINEYLGNYKEAADYLQRAVEIRRNLGDKNGTAGSLLILSSIYNKTGKTGSAIETAKEALVLSREVKSWRSIREAHAGLSEIYESNGFYKEALAEYKNYKAAHDSMFNSESQEKITELQQKYKAEEQKQQIELLQKQSEIQSLYRTLLAGGIILLLLISILLYSRYRLKHDAHETLLKLHESEMESSRLKMEAAEAKTSVLQKEFEQKKKELDAARELQLSMLPAELPNHPEIEISALMQTATEVGGDYYDFHQAEDGSLTIAIGDATGHGAQAGLMVTAAKSLFNLLAEEKDISEILNSSTQSIKKMNFTNIFMALGLLRFKEGNLEFAGAGMPPAYICRADSGKIEAIELKGLPLGSVAMHKYAKKSVRLNEGDVVALMSDGLPELFNEKNEQLGFEKIPLLLKEAAQKTPAEIIKYFTAAASQWLNGSKQQDDMTFVVFRVKPAI